MDVLKEFIKIVGEAYVKTDSESLKTFGTDWTKSYTPDPLCIVLPKNREELSEILKLCNEKRLPVVPSGGRTGLAGAAVASNREVVIAMDRFKKIVEIDKIGSTIVVEAGVTTQEVQEAARAAGLFFALDLAAKGSCQIGGNIATNAGGTKLIKYGGMREQILGLEVVLADGSVIDMNTSLRKNNTGYDLKHLFVGSEGTLGLVTQATLKLMPMPNDLQVICMATPRFEDIPKILQKTYQAGICPTAFEFFSNAALDLVLQFHASLKAPFQNRTDYYVLLELEDQGRAEQQIEKISELLFEEELISDAVLAQSSAQFEELWGLRENISESISQYGHVRKNDISVPVNKLSEFVSDLNHLVASESMDIELVLFGHIGDGNLHINYVGPKSLEKSVFKKQAEDLERKIFALLPKFQGSISAEHGIGLLKKEDLSLCRSGLEISMMREIKKIFDPRGIMNPGKIF